MTLCKSVIDKKCHCTKVPLNKCAQHSLASSYILRASSSPVLSVKNELRLIKLSQNESELVSMNKDDSRLFKVSHGELELL